MSAVQMSQGQPPEIRVSIVIGAAVLAQSAFALIWAGAAAERLAQLERQADAREVLLVRTARLEEQIASVKATLHRIETKIDDDARREETEQ